MEALARQLDGKLRRLSWMLQRQDRMRGFSGPNPAADPSRGQGRILAMLKLHDGVSTRDLSYLLGIRTSSLNEALAKLERAGLTRREPSDADRRVMLVKLTDKGRTAEQQETEPPDIYSCLTAQEQATLSSYLDRVIAALDANLRTSTPEAFEQMAQARERFGAEGPGPRGRGRGGPRWPDDGPVAGPPGWDPRARHRPGGGSGIGGFPQR
jgi:DNA-binding MarR family transcriptional regulator